MIQGGFLTVPPNFQHQNEKQLVANQKFCSIKFMMYKRSLLVEQRFSFQHWNLGATVKKPPGRSAGLLVSSNLFNPKVSYFCYLDYPTRHNWKVAVAKFMDPISAASKLEFHVRGAILQTRFFTIQSFNWKPIEISKVRVTKKGGGGVKNLCGCIF